MEKAVAKEKAAGADHAQELEVEMSIIYMYLHMKSMGASFCITCLSSQAHVSRYFHAVWLVLITMSVVPCCLNVSDKKLPLTCARLTPLYQVRAAK